MSLDAKTRHLIGFRFLLPPLLFLLPCGSHPYQHATRKKAPKAPLKYQSHPYLSLYFTPRPRSPRYIQKHFLPSSSNLIPSLPFSRPPHPIQPHQNPSIFPQLALIPIIRISGYSNKQPTQQPAHLSPLKYSFQTNPSSH